MKKRLPLHKQISFQLTCIVIILVGLCFFILLQQTDTKPTVRNMVIILAILTFLSPLLFLIFRYFLKPLQRADRDGKAQQQGMEICQAEKMEVAKLMAGGLAHDLNNILTGLISYPELLLMKLSDESPLRQPIENIRNTGRRAADIATDLQDMARNLTASKEKTSLVDTVRRHLQSPEHLAFLSQHSEMKVVTDLQEGLEQVSCPAEHITICLGHLLNNGAAASDGSGTLTIGTGRAPVDNSRPPLVQEKYVTLSITDTGEAIDKEDLNRVFEPFYMKRVMERNCSGLGMTVVWNIAREHGGKITVQSSDSGTRYTIHFPVAKDENGEQGHTT